MTKEEFAEKWFNKPVYNKEEGMKDFLADLADLDRDEQKKLAEQLKSENPYPDTVFLPISDDEIIKVVQYLRDGGFSPDALFGHWGRIVWNNCAERLMNF